MGWDAYAQGPQGGELKHADLKEFEKAAKLVRDVCGTVDGLLDEGGLDVSNCAYALEGATCQSAWNEHGWSAEAVKDYWAKSDWHISAEPWAACSARMFLKVCAERGLSIQFSY